MTYFQTIFAILITLISLTFACSGEHHHEDEHHHHEELSTSDATATSLVELTYEQIKTIGLTVGETQALKIAGFVKANGVLDLPPDEVATVTAPMSGFVRSTKGEYLVGSYVERGTVLARLEHPDYLQLQQDYLEAAAQLEVARQEEERQRALDATDNGVLKNLQEAAGRVKTLEARTRSLAAKLRYLGMDPARITAGELYSTVAVVAPISGYITALNINQGRFARPEDVLYEIVNNEHIHLELDVFESGIAGVRAGMRISFTVPALGTEIYAGEVRLVGRSFDHETKTVRVHGHVEGKHPEFLRGLYVEAKIWNDAATVAALPEGAIVSDAGFDYAFIQADTTPDGLRFRRVLVKTGEAQDGYVAISPLEELPADSRFVTAQAYYLAAQMMRGELEHEH